MDDTMPLSPEEVEVVGGVSEFVSDAEIVELVLVACIVYVDGKNVVELAVLVTTLEEKQCVDGS